jgi:hypothetical protein
VPLNELAVLVEDWAETETGDRTPAMSTGAMNTVVADRIHLMLAPEFFFLLYKDVPLAVTSIREPVDPMEMLR